MIDLDEYVEALTEETAIVSAMWANNETGVIFPVEDMARMAKDRNILFHTDAVQTVGKIPINLRELDIDFLSLSGHKLHAPKGIGVLYVKRGTGFVPFMTEGIRKWSGVAALKMWHLSLLLDRPVSLQKKRWKKKILRVKALRDKLENGLLSSIPKSILNGNKEHRLPNTSNISFEFVEGEAILLYMNRFNICASSGSACTSGSLEPSHVLRSMGVPFTAAHGSVRFSLSVYNTEEEIDYVLEKMPDIIKQLRDMSPFWPGD